MNCVVCHADLRSGAKFCPQCGTAQPVAPASNEPGPACPHCQAPLKPGAKFCAHCGESVTALAPVASTPPPMPEAAPLPAPEPELTLDPEPEAERPPERTPPASSTGVIRSEPTFARENRQDFAVAEKVRIEAAAPALTRGIPLLPVIGGITLALVAVGAGAWIMLSSSSAPVKPAPEQSLPVIAPAPAPAPIPVPASAPQATPPLRRVSPDARASAPASAPAAASRDEDEVIGEDAPASQVEKPKSRHKAAERTRDTESEEAYVRQMNKQLEEQIKDLRKQQNH